MPTDSLEQLNQRLLEFARERDWEQFHSPKNLAMALNARNWWSISSGSARSRA